jgi:hypothetical protein
MWPEASHQYLFVWKVIQWLWKWLSNLLKRLFADRSQKIRVVRKRTYIVQQIEELTIELPEDSFALGGIWSKHPKNHHQTSDFDVKSLPELE